MFIQIALLFVLSIIILSYISTRVILRICALILASFISVELFSIYIGGSLIDYKFYTQANWNDVWAGKDQFMLQGALAILVLIAMYFVLLKLAEKLRVYQFRNKKIASILLFFSCSFVLTLPSNSAFGKLYDIYKIQAAEDLGFDEALLNLGIPPSEYVKPQDLKSSAGKNIIIISMESIERGFLDSKFEKATPNLQRYSKELTFFNDMPQGPYSGWTSASLYTLLTGVPAMLKGNGNETLSAISNVKITGLGNVLNKAGYNATFLIGEADYAGTRDLVSTYKANVIDRGDLGNKYDKAPWGLYDYDLFAEAKNIISKTTEDNEPFALFLSTISTHPPHGVVDKRMKGKLPQGLSDHEFSIATLDYLIDDLIQYLKHNKLYENTAIYLFPDHLLMGLGSDKSIFDRLGSDRKLFLLTNIAKSKFSKSVSETIYQIDLPKLIIEGAEIKTNAIFLTDFIKNKNKINFLESNTDNIVKLNTASLTKRSFKGDIKISINGDTLNIISEEDKVAFPGLNLEKGIAKELVFMNDLVLVKNKTLKIGDAFKFKGYDKNYLSLLLEIKDSTIYSYFGDKNKIGHFSKGINQLVIPKAQVNAVVSSSKEFSQTVKHNAKDYFSLVNFLNLIKVTSSNYDYHKVTPTSAVFNGHKFKFKRGINLVYFNGEKDTIETYDTHAIAEDAIKLITRLKELHKKNIEYTLFAHDSASNEIKLISDELKCLGYYDLPLLESRQPYVAYYNTGALNEYIGSGTITTILPWRVSINNKEGFTSLIKSEYAKDKNRFIAHAGGQIEGKKYTNVLEALDYNYKRGFRLFELDFMKTSDNYFVAGHDWKHWKSISGYKGDVPTTKTVFLQQKIFGKYTPMDMLVVNSWFKNHSDAILVTDKVNAPNEFVPTFIDKNRLMMELFSLSAVKEGLSAKIRSAMPSEAVINGMKGDKVKTLTSLGVKNIALSRKSISKNRALLKALKEAGIKVYVYHVNFGKEFDEEYVLNKELKYVYGMYADSWNFTDTSCK